VAKAAPGLATRKIVAAHPRDSGPARHRIGLIALDSDVATEQDFHRMLPDDVMYYTTRVHHVNPVSVVNLRKMGPQLTAAAGMLVPGQRLDAIAYSCTSATAAIGYDEVAAQVRAGGRPDVPVVTPITAALAGLAILGVESISLLTPHPDGVNQSTRRFFEAHGITVSNIGSFCLDNDIAVAEVPPRAIHEAALEACHADADALFISSTALRAAEIVEAAERALGKPVLSAVQCLFWHALRLAGCDAKIEGFGRLMRL
jgi:maleate isomerase